jgi:hypothetical protein
MEHITGAVSALLRIAGKCRNITLVGQGSLPLEFFGFINSHNKRHNTEELTDSGMK